MPELKKTAALAALKASRQELLKAIAGLSEEQMTTIPVEGSWTVRDLLAHIASWERACLEPLHTYAAGSPFIPEDIPDDLVWNDRQALAWQALSLPEILRDFTDTRRALLTVLDTLSPERWEQPLRMPWREEGPLPQMLSGLAWHESEHVHSIQKLTPK